MASSSKIRRWRAQIGGDQAKTQARMLSSEKAARNNSSQAEKETTGAMCDFFSSPTKSGSILTRESFKKTDVSARSCPDICTVG